MFDKYLNEINRLYRSGKATEHSYRPALQDCINGLLKNVHVTNEPKRQRCGAPDYILTRRKIDIGYIEAKDVGVDLDKTERDEQLERYRASLDNLILTDYLEFRFYLNSQKVETVRIAEQSKKGIVPKPENFAHLQTLLTDFAAFEGQPIKSAKKLAEMMAHKAALMRDVFLLAVKDESGSETSLKDQLKAFQTVLMHDMDEAQFADVYAQTIAYGLFTARLHEEKPKEFSRAEALNLIPKSNPFLRQLFHYIAGPDLDPRVVWIVDALCEVYRAADIHAIMKDFGIATGKNDPILHFYETFLAEYNPALREKRGVYYTPEPVVHFIVRAIDDCLKTHFGLKDGLANTSMVEIEIEGQGKAKSGKPAKIKKQVHKVQLLDVATGTGTFLAEIVKRVYAGFEGQQGAWSGYVEQHLLPRVHGFELLMASYAMCHMKLDLLLKETGYEPSNPASPPRLGVYLTNTLEEYHPDTDTLFAQWLSKEANEASRIKKDMPIMVALGNPPYSSKSSNNSKWIQELLADYKRGLKERKINLDDDYIKFIRCAEYYIEKIGYGIVAMITNNSFLDGKSHRKMRERLMKNFDEIMILNLNGDVKSNLKGEDENVFDIQQGVCIFIFVKSKGVAAKSIKFYDLRGTREAKYSFLNEKNALSIGESLIPKAPDFYFTKARQRADGNIYGSFFPLNELFETYSSGIQTKRDKICIADTPVQVMAIIEDFKKLKADELRSKYELPPDGRDWQIDLAKKDILENAGTVRPILYRPFDIRCIYYTGKTKGFIAYPRHEVMQHILDHDNICLIANRQCVGDTYSYISVSRNINCHGTFYLGNRGQDYIFPLFKYEHDLLGQHSVNFKQGIFDKFKKFRNKSESDDILAQRVFDYILAALHSREYRKIYRNEIMSDFPRIPYPKDPKTFDALANKGAELRGLHLMENPVLDKLITAYPVTGSHEVVAMRWEDTKGKPGLGRVWLNPTQYFDKVPLMAWEFYIGGYQPAQKWLKDRKGRNLTSNELKHWQRIIVALTEIDRIMNEIDQIDFLPKE